MPLSKHGGSLNLENCRNSVVFLGPSSLIDKAKISLVGENCVFFADSGLGRAEISVYNGCCLYIGSGCCINPAGTQRIAVAEASSIIIGNGAWFSYPVDIRTSDWHPVYDVSTRARVNQAESIILGDHVWVCRACSIYKGSKVASGSIIGANSILSRKCCPYNSIIAGYPAKVVKRDLFWNGSATSNADQAELELLETLPGEHASVQDFIYLRAVNEMIYPADIYKTLHGLHSASEKLAFLYDVLYCSSARNRFAWDEPDFAQNDGKILSYDSARFAREVDAEVEPIQVSDFCASGVPHLEDCLSLLLSEEQMRRKYHRYMICSILLFGRKARKYRQKAEELKPLLEKISQIRRYYREPR